MGLGAGRGLSWCAWLCHHQHLHARVLRQSSRNLFSKTGVWETELTQKEREEIENHWMPIIKDNDQQRCQNMDSSKDKYYVLSMFPYPSGKLHMGHVRVYTLSDTMARFHQLTGRNVIHPMGWDAFGLPAENAAIERGEKPDHWTHQNIANMRTQLEQLGCSFDWHREFATCDPAYYKWTQHLFLKMLDAGLVYQKEGEVNWDPVDNTVLADEQIDEAGKSWRSGAKAEKRFLKQWYMKTTAKAQSLYEGLEEVDQNLWGDIIQLQRHWIGECDGTRLQFSIQSPDGGHYEPLLIYTSSPEAVYGVAYIALSPQHRLNQTALYQENYSEDAKDKVLTLKGTHPFTGDHIPIVVSSSTEFDEFNDVQLGIPSVDETAQMIADQLGLSYHSVLQEKDGEERLVNSHDITGLSRSEAFQAVLKKAKDLSVGGDSLSRRLRDWLISRQRYWGTPIPIIYCDKCQVVPVPYEDLPVKLPSIDKFTGRGPSPLAQQQDWINTTCPNCGGAARRETDTMDTFVDSSWYFLRYLDPTNMTEPYKKEVADKYMPVDLYIGGKEHAVMHLYYARFFCHFLHGKGLLPQREPFVNLLTQGMVMGQSYRIKGTGRYLTEDQVDMTGPKPKEKSSGMPVVTQWEKMSKSKYNGVDPKEVLDQFGVDATRLCILSSVSPQANRKWSNEAYTGILRWQSRIWRLVGNLIRDVNAGKGDGCSDAELAEWDEKLYEARNYTVKEVTFHCSTTFLLNTAVSRLQKYTTTLGDKTVLDQAWPEIDADYTLPLILKINHQDNGCVSLTRNVLDTLTRDLAHDLVRPIPKYQQYCQGHKFATIDFSLYPGYQAIINFVPEKREPHSCEQSVV